MIFNSLRQRRRVRRIMNRHQMIHNRHGQFEVSTDLVRQTLDKITDACCNRNVHALEMVLKSLSQDQLERYLNAMVEGHQINCLDTYFTPLMIASAKEHDSIVRFLLENYSAYCIVDAENYSSQYDFDDDFDVDHVNHQTALWVAVQYEHLNIVQTLISLGKANINQRADKTYTVSNQTPLYLACQHGQTEMVKYLVENGADLYHTNKDDSTALMVACKYEHVDVVEYLLSLDDSDHHLLNASNKEGSTALHEAASTEYLDMVKLLLEEHHAKIIKDNDGLTPLTKAGMVDQQEVVEYLIGNTEHSWYTSSQIIDELELIGSCYVTCSYRENDYVRAYRYLRQAMKLRYRNPTRPILKTNLPAPIDAYGYHIECQTMEELKSLNRNPTRLIIECFMIRERLGGVTSNFLNSLDEQANVGAYDLFSFDPDTLIRTSKECQLALQFWLHSCHLRVQTQIGLNKCVSHLEECVRLMGNLIHRQRTKDIGFDMVMNVLQVAENEFLRNRNLALISDVESIVDQSSSILFDDINMTTIDIADRCLHMIVNLLFIALKVSTRTFAID